MLQRVDSEFRQRATGLMPIAFGTAFAVLGPSPK